MKEVIKPEDRALIDPGQSPEAVNTAELIIRQSYEKQQSTPEQLRQMMADCQTLSNAGVQFTGFVRH